MRRNGFFDSNFLIRHGILAIGGHLLLIFALNRLNVCHSSTSGLVGQTYLESVSRDAHLTVKVSTKFEVDTTIHCLVIVLLLLIRYMTLWPWPFDLVQWSYLAGHMVNPPPSLKTLWLSVLELWVLTSPIGYHWQCILQPMRMRRITWPMCRVQIFPAYLKSLTPFCVCTMQLLWCCD